MRAGGGGIVKAGDLAPSTSGRVDVCASAGLPSRRVFGSVAWSCIGFAGDLTGVFGGAAARELASADGGPGEGGGSCDNLKARNLSGLGAGEMGLEGAF